MFSWAREGVVAWYGLIVQHSRKRFAQKRMQMR